MKNIKEIIKKLLEEQLSQEVDEAKKKKKKKKKKAKRDACYHKVKARYDVWPSAYASGALVKCRKVGAKNWGKTTTKEDYQLEEGMYGMSEPLDYVVVDKRNLRPLMMNHSDGFYEKWSTKEKAQADAEALNRAYQKTYGAVEGPHVVMYKSDYFTEKFTEKRKNELMEGKKWSKKYKDSIDCNNPKGFSQKAHCAGKKKRLEEKRKLTKKPSSETSLRDWFKRKGAKGSTGGWVDCNAPDGKGGYKSCGRKSGEKRSKYPACRPTPSACKSKGKGKKWGKKSKNEAVNYHLDKKIPLNECIFRHGSEGHLKFINDARDFVNETKLYVNHDERELLRTDLGSYGLYEGEKVPLDLPMINEAEYRGKKVTLNKPKRGGSKAYYVYVKDPKSGNVKKVSFGSSGLRAKINNRGAVKSFVARHKCKQKNDKTKPGYWSCRLPRYAKSLGLSGGGGQWW